MKTTTTKEHLTIEVRTFTSSKGSTFKLNGDISTMVQDFIIGLEDDLKAQCIKEDKKAVVKKAKKVKEKSPEQIISEEYFTNYYSEYYNINKDRMHVSKNNIKRSGYSYYIAHGLALRFYERSYRHGYGLNQIGGNYIKETLNIAESFVDFMLNRSNIDLSTINPHYKNDKLSPLTIGEGLYWYCIRCGYYDKMDQLAQYVYKEEIPLYIQSIILKLLRNDTENATKQEGTIKTLWQMLNIVSSLTIVSGISLLEMIPNDEVALLNKLYTSHINNKFIFLLKDGNEYILDLTYLKSNTDTFSV